MTVASGMSGRLGYFRQIGRVMESLSEEVTTDLIFEG